MKNAYLIFAILWMLTCLESISGQTANGCVDGKRFGIYYTDCWTRAPGADDSSRLQAAITATYGKLVFNESEYNISKALTLHSSLVIEGTGKGSDDVLSSSSKIKQNTSGLAVFAIGPGVNEVAIRDIALIGGGENNVGILAEGNGPSSLHFVFTGIRLKNFQYGIKVVAPPNQTWQFDDVQLRNATIEDCLVGIYVDTPDSGWYISGVHFPSHRSNGYAFQFKRIAYTSIDHVIANSNAQPQPAVVFFIEGHNNTLLIQNSSMEGFNEDVVINGPDRTFPIYLLNNHFVGKVTVNNSTVVSSGNQFGGATGGPQANIPVIAKGYSQIYSIGDKFCFEGGACQNKNYELQDAAELVFSTNQFKSTSSVKMELTREGDGLGTPLLSLTPKNYAGESLLRLGRGNYWYDITRSESDATLTFRGSASNYGYGYTFDANGGSFRVKNGFLNFSDDPKDSGTITLKTTSFSYLGSVPNGTLYYCADCQPTAACSSGGSGAIAKRINNSWVCN